MEAKRERPQLLASCGLAVLSRPLADDRGETISKIAVAHAETLPVTNCRNHRKETLTASPMASLSCYVPSSFKDARLTE
jgi:hypothetical protein